MRPRPLVAALSAASLLAVSRSIAARAPALRVTYCDVEKDPAAMARLRESARERDPRVIGVLAFIVNGELIMGFASAETTGARIREVLDLQERESLLDVPLVGSVGIGDFGLPTFTIIVGLVDGFNLCAMRVLLFLLGSSSIYAADPGF